MTFSTKTMRRWRAHRSELAVPATSLTLFRKAAASPADVIFLDLEDAVAPSLKVQARENAIGALRDIDWGRKTLAVRVNGLDTDWGQRDLIEVASNCPRLDMVLVPKIGTPFDVQFVDALLTGIEREKSRAQKIGIEILIETTLGLVNVEQIAASCERLEAIIFGVGDYSIDLETCGEMIGASDPRYSVLAAPDSGGQRVRHMADQWHFALARIANACKAYGLRAIDGPYANFGDPEGYRASAERGAALGFDGKWAIHPSQVAIANDVFTPPAHRVSWARQILSAIEQQNAEGKGAFQQGGVLIDMAVEKIARAILARRLALEESAGGIPREPANAS